MPPARPIHPLLRHDSVGVPSARPDSPDRRADRILGRFGIFLFLASLTMLFGASLVGFIAIRWFGTHAAEPGHFPVPVGFYYSTAVLLAAGVAMELAARSVRPLRRRAALLAAWALSAAFIVLQTPPLIELYRTHEAAIAAHAQTLALAGFVFTLIVVHALHVVGGMVPLTVVAINQCTPGRRDPSAAAVRATAAYWHFLDCVWLTMLGVFLLAH